LVLQFKSRLILALMATGVSVDAQPKRCRGCGLFYNEDNIVQRAKYKGLCEICCDEMNRGLFENFKHYRDNYFEVYHDKRPAKKKVCPLLGHRGQQRSH